MNINIITQPNNATAQQHDTYTIQIQITSSSISSLLTQQPQPTLVVRTENFTNFINFISIYRYQIIVSVLFLVYMIYMICIFALLFKK